MSEQVLAMAEFLNIPVGTQFYVKQGEEFYFTKINHHHAKAQGYEGISHFQPTDKCWCIPNSLVIRIPAAQSGLSTRIEEIFDKYAGVPRDPCMDDAPSEESDRLKNNFNPNEDKPDIDAPVLVAHKSRKCWLIAQWSGEKWYEWNTYDLIFVGNVVAWCPLPDLPKGASPNDSPEL